MKNFIIPVCALALAGCGGNKTIYEWGSYQPALVRYYKNKDAAAFEEKLTQSLQKAEKARKVPPGLNAELGYLLYEKGDFAGAEKRFENEKTLFPESAVLMDKMIAGSQAANNRGAAK